MPYAAFRPLIPGVPVIPPAQDSGTSPVNRIGHALQWTRIPYADCATSMDDSDEALMARVARGDEPAYRTLTRRHLPAMLGLARRILGNAADAEDVAQEAMLRVWTQIGRARV